MSPMVTPTAQIQARVDLVGEAHCRLPLTRRETDVALLLRKGLTYTQISKELGISMNTMKGHVTRLYDKLCINSRDDIPEDL